MNVDDLYGHQIELSHLKVHQTPRGPGYLCWKKGCNQYFGSPQALQVHFREIHGKRPQIAISERHVYKYRCNQCSLAFKTVEKLQLHAQYHVIRAATKCNICDRNFRSIAALQRHVETSHPDVSEAELEQYKSCLAASLMSQGPGQTIENDIKREIEEGEIVEGMPGDMDTSSLDADTAGNTNEDNDDVSRERQFLDDYLNSQTMSEENYSDPNRKFKCHRCKVAYTKQNYLLSHNKTLMHRKGDRFSSPMEKYMDPNRPYKCDVCKESFTQKSILLVHYNSVSHLHKLKKSAAESKSSAASPDTERKPYRCNICKVAYSQGSTLDIHIRSVLHQTRASKLQELALTGQVDLTQPLIEQPDFQKPGKDQEQQHKKMLEEMLASSSQQKAETSSLTLTQPTQQSSPAATSTATSPMSSFMNSLMNSQLVSASSLAFPLQGTTQLSQHPLLFPPQQLFTCPNCNSVFMTQEALGQHQKLFCFFGQPQPHSSQTSPGASNPNFPSAEHSVEQVQHHEDEQLLKQPLFMRRSKSAIHKQLLEGFGFEIVMQYNEYYRRKRKRKVEDEDDKQEKKSDEEGNDKKNETIENNESEKKTSADSVNNENQICSNENPEEKKLVDQVEEKTDETPEVNKCSCNKCGRDFSSVWVLKAHEEERHKELVPLRAIEEFAEKFKEDFEKKIRQQQQQLLAEEAHETAMSVSSQDTHGSSAPSTPAFSQSQSVLPGIDSSYFTPQMLNFGFNFGFPVNMNVNMSMLAAMNLHPPLIPIMMNPYTDPLHQQAGISQPVSDLLSTQQQAAAVLAQQASHKRGRTRINDDQLKVLRAHFDINNSPNEEQILEMSDKTGLPPKVIKHWFRNTLFKERQRNKDSPYNFNNPPSTTFNIEEYEKTGELPKKQQKEKCEAVGNQRQEQSEENQSFEKHDQKQNAVSKQCEDKHRETEKKLHSPHQLMQQQPSPQQHQQQPLLQDHHQQQQLHQQNDKTDNFQQLQRLQKQMEELHDIHNQQLQQQQQKADFKTFLQARKDKHHFKTEPDEQHHSRTSFASMSSLLSSVSASTGLSSLALTSLASPSPYSIPPLYSQASFDISTSSFNTIPTTTTPPNTMQSLLPLNHQSLQGTSHHSSVLSAASSANSDIRPESTPRRANRTRFSDYQVKVLQDYFEKNAYPKDDELDHLSKMLNLSPRVIVVWFQNARQKARKVYENQPPPDGAAELRYNRTPGLNYQCKKCNLVFQRYYELIKHQKTLCYKEDVGKYAMQDSQSMPSPSCSNSSTGSTGASQVNTTARSLDTKPNDTQKQEHFSCEKCNLSFPRFDLWKEHQSAHILDPTLMFQFNPNSPFGQLQTYEAQRVNSPVKRKAEDGESVEEDQHGKRLRTTILPEQLDFLHQQYQQDANPSRKQLDEISREVGLRKRVVQVWFQNTRARERKGQYRSHLQAIHKRCPFCRALFKARSALESHLATKHADQISRGEINIDAIPNAEPEAEGGFYSAPNTPTSDKVSSPMSSFPDFPNPSASNHLEVAMKRFYEDSLRRYLEQLSSPNQKHEDVAASVKQKETATSDSKKPPEYHEKVEDKHVENSIDENHQDSFSETQSIADSDCMSYQDDANNPTSPNSSIGSHKTQCKRFRTQMNSLMVKVRG